VAIVEEDRKLKLPEEDKLSVGDTLVQTLWYNCTNHWGEKENEGITMIRTDFNLSNRENEWIVITGLAKDWLCCKHSVRALNRSGTYCMSHTSN